MGDSTQRRNQVRWHSRQEATSVPPCLNLRTIRSRIIYFIEETTCDIVGTFHGPHSDLEPGELCSFTSAHNTPDWTHAANADPCPSPASYDVKSLSAVNKTLLTSIKYWGPHTKGPFVAMDQRR